MNEEKGGPAFPWVQPATGDNGAVICYGMTLRDYFAAKAMQGIISERGWASDQSYFNEQAQGAYRFADAMLKARKA